MSLTVSEPKLWVIKWSVIMSAPNHFHYLARGNPFSKRCEHISKTHLSHHLHALCTCFAVVWCFLTSHCISYLLVFFSILLYHTFVHTKMAKPQLLWTVDLILCLRSVRSCAILWAMVTAWWGRASLYICTAWGSSGVFACLCLKAAYTACSLCVTLSEMELIKSYL